MKYIKTFDIVIHLVNKNKFYFFVLDKKTAGMSLYQMTETRGSPQGRETLKVSETLRDGIEVLCCCLKLLICYHRVGFLFFSFLFSIYVCFFFFFFLSLSFQLRNSLEKKKKKKKKKKNPGGSCIFSFHSYNIYFFIFPVIFFFSIH